MFMFLDWYKFLQLILVLSQLGVAECQWSSVARYHCNNKDHELSSPDIVSCLANRTWSEEILNVQVTFRLERGYSCCLLGTCFNELVSTCNCHYSSFSTEPAFNSILYIIIGVSVTELLCCLYNILLIIIVVSIRMICT